MIEGFIESLVRQCNISPNSRILLAVSGGPDSMAMLHLFCDAQADLNVHLEAAHLNHRIRGIEGDEDARFVAEACPRLEIPCKVFGFDVPRFAIRHQLSLEEAGRRIRRHFFFRYAQAHRLDHVAFAHTADDQAETIIMNFLRGAGPRGLAGMSARSRNVIHPLLTFTKAELKNYLDSRQISYRIDRTNEDSSYFRNRVRTEILPFLQRHSGGELRTRILQAAEIFRDEDTWLEKLVRDEFKTRFRVLAPGVTRITLSSAHVFPRALVRRMLRQFLLHSIGSLDGIEYSHIESLMELLEKQSGRRYEFRTFDVERTSEGLSFSVKWAREKRSWGRSRGHFPKGSVPKAPAANTI